MINTVANSRVRSGRMAQRGPTVDRREVVLIASSSLKVARFGSPSTITICASALRHSQVESFRIRPAHFRAMGAIPPDPLEAGILCPKALDGRFELFEPRPFQHIQLLLGEA